MALLPTLPTGELLSLLICSCFGGDGGVNQLRAQAKPSAAGPDLLIWASMTLRQLFSLKITGLNQKVSKFFLFRNHLINILIKWYRKVTDKKLRHQKANGLSRKKEQYHRHMMFIYIASCCVYQLIKQRQRPELYLQTSQTLRTHTHTHTHTQT